ncbi:phage major head subunit gpT-like protein [Crenobacter luteus]|uniref:Mu-like prophage major head subunit gpT family protein n=1 Tax=Crenobacter luteus TaxID=1452487 RepID=UPI0010518F3F|nr:Mu-like prophage major head subunit gpT family protein [Crenobacter luteus]TCP09247.1 phage major head subunit gpT-like protein [Crenobacter luteus]
MIVTPAVLTTLKTGFKGEYQNGLTLAESVYDKVATRVPSATASNTYGWLGQFPQFREWIGERVIRDMAAKGYQITNKLFESTVGVKRTDIEDDNLGIYAPLFQEMGRAAAVYPDELVFALLKEGTASACYDGQYFFDTDHPVFPNVDGTGVATTVANYDNGGAAPGAAWYLLDTSRAIKPLIFQERTKPELQALTATDDEAVFMKDEYRYGVRARSNVGFGFWQMAYCSKKPLDSNSFNAAVEAMMSFKADGGRPLGIKPTLLVVPPTLRAAALEVVKAERLANGATNTNRDVVDVLVTPWVM